MRHGTTVQRFQLNIEAFAIFAAEERVLCFSFHSCVFPFSFALSSSVSPFLSVIVAQGASRFVQCHSFEVLEINTSFVLICSFIDSLIHSSIHYIASLLSRAVLVAQPLSSQDLVTGLALHSTLLLQYSRTRTYPASVCYPSHQSTEDSASSPQLVALKAITE